jgi:hypothetical protein
MGEIKSTLDIIMEKTKGLTMTEEERQAFQKKEVEGKVRGLLQKFLDNLLDLDRLKVEMAGLGRDRQEMARSTLKEECLDRIDPEADNTSLFNVLKHVVRVGTGPIQKALSVFHEDLERQKSRNEAALREHLRQQGISGTAVLPNLRADSEWGRYLSRSKKELRERFLAAELETI